MTKIKTAQEFKEARRKLGLSGAQLGAIINTDPRTIRKWEQAEGANARAPNPIACRVLEWMLAGFKPEDYAR